MPRFDPWNWLSIGALVNETNDYPDRLMRLGDLQSIVASHSVSHCDDESYQLVQCEKNSALWHRAVRLIILVIEFETGWGPHKDHLHPMDQGAGSPDNGYDMFGWPADNLPRALTIWRAAKPVSSAPERDRVLELLPMERPPASEQVTAKQAASPNSVTLPQALQPGDQLLIYAVLKAIMAIRQNVPGGRDTTEFVRGAVARLSGRKMDAGTVHLHLDKASAVHLHIDAAGEKMHPRTADSCLLLIGTLAAEVVPCPPSVVLTVQVTDLVQRFGLCASVEAVRSTLDCAAEVLADTCEKFGVVSAGVSRK